MSCPLLASQPIQLSHRVQRRRGQSLALRRPRPSRDERRRGVSRCCETCSPKTASRVNAVCRGAAALSTIHCPSLCPSVLARRAAVVAGMDETRVSVTLPLHETIQNSTDPSSRALGDWELPAQLCTDLGLSRETRTTASFRLITVHITLWIPPGRRLLPTATPLRRSSALASTTTTRNLSAQVLPA